MWGLVPLSVTDPDTKRPLSKHQDFSLKIQCSLNHRPNDRCRLSILRWLNRPDVEKTVGLIQFIYILDIVGDG